MSGYAGTGKATLLRDNQQIFLWRGEPAVAGMTSMAVQLERVNRSYYPWGVSFQIYFSDANGNPANPGAFEVDIQTSDVDTDVQYTQEATYTGTKQNAEYVGRVALTNFYARYARAYVQSVTNSVYISVLATR